jgi:hypothetical protein
MTMMKLITKNARRLLYVVLPLVVAACAQKPPPPKVLKFNQLTNYSRIALEAKSSAHPVLAHRPKSRGAAAAEGARTGLEFNLGGGSCSGSFCGAVVLFQLVWLATATASGAIIGAASAHDEEEIAIAQKSITTVYDNEQPAATIKEMMIANARAKGLCGIIDANELSLSDREVPIVKIDVSQFGFVMDGDIRPDVIPFIEVKLSTPD